MFSLPSYMIFQLLRFTHYCLVYLFLDITCDHIVITVIVAAYLLLSIFNYPPALLMIYTWSILNPEAEMRAI